jgi:hypothetical protein
MDGEDGDFEEGKEEDDLDIDNIWVIQYILLITMIFISIIIN